MEKMKWSDFSADENLHHMLILSAQLIARLSDEKRHSQAEDLRQLVIESFVDVEDALADLEAFAGRKIFE